MGMTTAADWAAKPRHLDPIVLTEVEVTDDGWVTCRAKGQGFSLKLATCESLPIVGRDYEIETVLGSTVTGLRSSLGWMMHKTDQQLADDHNAMLADFARKRRETLEANRELWTKQETALPEWLRERLARFHANGGEAFALDDWGYELFICRLAALLDAGDDTAADELARDGGASGNQWDCAKALVAAHRDGHDLASFPAGLTPLTGDPFYRGKAVTTP